MKMKITPTTLFQIAVGRFYMPSNGNILFRIEDSFDNGAYGSGYPVFQAVDSKGHVTRIVYSPGEPGDPVHLVEHDQDPFAG